MNIIFVFSRMFKTLPKIISKNIIYYLFMDQMDSSHENEPTPIIETMQKKVEEWEYKYRLLEYENRLLKNENELLQIVSNEFKNMMGDEMSKIDKMAQTILRR